MNVETLKKYIAHYRYCIWYIVIVVAFSIFLYSEGRNSAERDAYLERVRSTHEQLESARNELDEAARTNQSARTVVDNIEAVNQQLTTSIEYSERASEDASTRIVDAQKLIDEARTELASDRQRLERSKSILASAYERSKKTAIEAEKK